ncbi:hypothetical protein BU16DRAFT_90968 [Lophium mytilinum]|uniref:Uncharacterized protein n=1 Tax=Lophium mytilinum TaxID=390894 RepID=A0A6A6QL47_9PEZI|nr:hypothetical protein BU16DRAFT_90968 [Lophium mytilinum]
MSAVNLTKQIKSLAHLDSRRPISRGRDDARPASSKAPRGKKESQRDLTPNLKTQDVRRSSAPSPSRTSFIIGPGEQRSLGGTSPKPQPDDWFGDEPNTWERKPKRRSSKHPDPVLQTRTQSSPIITLNRQDSDGPLTYAQAAGALSVGSMQRTSITTIPEWAVQRKSHTPAPVSSRKYSGMPSPALKKSESIDTQSDIAASVFDDDEENHVNSDLETEISTASLDDLPPELNRDERLIRPERYYCDLEELEANVAGNSALFLLKRENRQAYPHGRYLLNFDFHGDGGTASNQSKNYDDLIMSFCNERSRSSKDSGSSAQEASSREAFASWAFHVLECRNLMLQIKSNLAKMVASRYCDTSISVLSVDRHRPGVARLTRIEIDKIAHLGAVFEESLEMIISKLGQSHKVPPELVKKLKDITRRCENILDRLRLPKGNSISRSGQVGMWRKVAMVLDISIISYCGAHIERFDANYLGEDLDFAKITAAWTYVVDGSEGIMIRRRSLSCLDGFLGSHKVWTFQSSLLWDDNQPLYLSTTIDDFADIWGPVWAAKQTEDSDSVIKYDTGSGSIVHWYGDQTAPEVEENEVPSHWIPRGEKEANSKVAGAIEPGARLLIGASTEIEKRTSQLKVNPACKISSHEFLRRLHMTNMLDDLGTRPPTRVLAEETVGANVGAYGVAIGASKTYKRRSGVTLKDAICDAWKHNNGNRNPAILEHFIGLEVSLCSHNARRRRLKSIINTPTMRSWLETCKSSTAPFACEKAFHEAIESRDRRAFRDLYNKHREWRRDLGQLVSWCLEGLRHSNVDQDRTLRALWVTKDDERYRVQLRQNPHSWTGFLADSETKCTFAVMTEDCLQTDYKYGGRCQIRDKSNASNLGLPVLETALCVNRAAPLPKGLELRLSERKHKQQNRWSISGLQPNQTFPLSAGRLLVVERFAHTRLVVEWDISYLKKLHEVKQSLTRSVGREQLFHWELRDEEDWLEEKPVPVFVRSQYAVKY